MSRRVPRPRRRPIRRVLSSAWVSPMCELIFRREGLLPWPGPQRPSSAGQTAYYPKADQHMERVRRKEALVQVNVIPSNQTPEKSRRWDHRAEGHTRRALRDKARFYPENRRRGCAGCAKTFHGLRAVGRAAVARRQHQSPFAGEEAVRVQGNFLAGMKPE